MHLNFFLSSLLTSIFSILFSFLVLERCHNKDDLLERKLVHFAAQSLGCPNDCHPNFAIPSTFLRNSLVSPFSFSLFLSFSLSPLLPTSPVWCRALLVLYRYSRLSNYLWMVCEALYLHQLVVNAFRRVKYLLRFCLIGWLIPFALMIPYVLMHANEERDHGCWIDDEDTHFEWVYHLPPIVCLVVSRRAF